MSISWIMFKTLSPLRPNAWTDLESPGGEHHEHQLDCVQKNSLSYGLALERSTLTECLDPFPFFRRMETPKHLRNVSVALGEPGLSASRTALQPRRARGPAALNSKVHPLTSG